MRKGQISLEFIIVFGLFTILLLYSIRNVSFSEGTSSVENLKIQVALEEKNLANVISNTISQVYAQGPGSKVTSYVKLVYLRKPDYLKKAWGINDSKVFVTYGYLPGGPLANGTYVMVIGNGTTKIALSGGNKSAFWSGSLYSVDLTENSSAWSSNFGNSASLEINGSITVYGLVIPPGEIPTYLKVVVEWNPDRPQLWVYDGREIHININPGG